MTLSDARVKTSSDVRVPTSIGMPAAPAAPAAPVDDAVDDQLAGRLNWLRAGVLGANDGIVSTAALILGVAGATATRGPIVLAGLVGLLAGAMSMAVGEFVSVSAQRDAERGIGRPAGTLVDPVQAAVASFVSFVVGAAIPLLGVVISPNAWVAVAMVTVALAATGATSARLGRSSTGLAVVRNVIGGLLAMAVTFGLGNLVGGLF